MIHTVKTPERFTYESHRWFRDVTEKVQREDSLILDFIGTDYIDSSALGMMLVARDKFSGVSMINCCQNVMKIFEIANFKKIFNIKQKG